MVIEGIFEKKIKINIFKFPKKKTSTQKKSLTSKITKLMETMNHFSIYPSFFYLNIYLPASFYDFYTRTEETNKRS